MSPPVRAPRCALLGSVAAGLLAFATMTSLPASALGAPGDTCISGFERGQEAKKKGLLVKARAELRLCSGACPEALATECRAWLVDVEGRIGRVRVDVRDAAGRSVEAAVVKIDGAPAPDGEVEVDPGAHAITVTIAGFLPFQRNIDVGPGAMVPVSAVLTALPPPPPPPAPNLSLTLGLGITGGLGVLAGGALLAFGKVEEGRLAATCRPSCTRESVALIERVWIGGAAALGAGAILGAVALIVWPGAARRTPQSATLQGWIDPQGGGGIVGAGHF